jgi:hypothetical protein
MTKKSSNYVPACVRLEAYRAQDQQRRQALMLKYLLGIGLVLAGSLFVKPDERHVVFEVGGAVFLFSLFMLWLNSDS